MRSESRMPRVCRRRASAAGDALAALDRAPVPDLLFLVATFIISRPSRPELRAPIRLIEASDLVRHACGARVLYAWSFR